MGTQLWRISLPMRMKVSVGREWSSRTTVVRVKAWCLTVWRILEYTLCIIAYTLISLAGIHSSGIRVTWFWFSASKKAPIRRCASDRCSYRAEYGKQPILGWFYSTITALWFAQTDNTKQPKRFQLLHSFCNLFCLFIIAANIVQFSFHQIQRLNYTICKSQSQGFSWK